MTTKEQRIQALLSGIGYFGSSVPPMSYRFTLATPPELPDIAMHSKRRSSILQTEKQ